MAAITGVDKFSIKSKREACPLAARASPSSLVKWANSEISAPATNAFSPLPVRIITFTFLSAFKELIALCNSSIVSLFNALSLEGRFIVTTAMLFSVLTS